MSTIRYGSVCSGIEAATCAWHPLGWQPEWFSEIEPFACALLAHRHPAVPNLGDMTTIADRVRARDVPAPDLLVGGTPCQSFSVAGLRRGLADPRGQLTRSFVEILDAIDSVRPPGDPGLALWENVPGVLNDDDNAFGNLLAALVGEDRALDPPGGRWSDAGAVLGPARRAAWRVLDARHFGLPQRRRRVFLVVGAHAGPVDPVEVLLVEPDLRDPPPKGRRTRADRPTRPRGRTPLAGGGRDPDHPDGRDGDGSPTPFAFDAYNFADADVTHTLRRGRGNGADDAIPITLDGRGVRRMTPLEYERLQGFPEGHSLVPWRGRPAEDCPDDPRYRALGNSMAVPVMAWIGRRIADVRAGTAPRLDRVSADLPADALELFCQGD